VSGTPASTKGAGAVDISSKNAGKSKGGENARTLIFGGQVVSMANVFISRRYVYAMVNPKPVTTGHVLICPTRQVRRFKDLTELEVLELFICAKEVVQKFESQYQSRNFMILIQDGKYACSSPHEKADVHLQIIPRDEQNTDIQN